MSKIEIEVQCWEICDPTPEKLYLEASLTKSVLDDYFGQKEFTSEEAAKLLVKVLHIKKREAVYRLGWLVTMGGMRWSGQSEKTLDDERKRREEVYRIGFGNAYASKIHGGC